MDGNIMDAIANKLMAIKATSFDVQSSEQTNLH